MRTYSMGLHDNDESMILNHNMGAGAVEGQSNPEFGDPWYGRSPDCVTDADGVTRRRAPSRKQDVTDPLIVV
jgi:hypothetical protein